MIIDGRIDIVSGQKQKTINFWSRLTSR